MGNVDFAALRDVAAFGSLHAAGPADQLRVPPRAHAGRLRELGRGDRRHAAFRPAALDETVDALPTIRRPGTPSRGTPELKLPSGLHLLVDGHQRQQVRDALFDGERGIAEGRGLRRLRRRQGLRRPVATPRRTPRTAPRLPWRGQAPSSEPRVSCAPPVVWRCRPARRVDGGRRAQPSALREVRSTCKSLVLPRPGLAESSVRPGQALQARRSTPSAARRSLAPG